MLEAASSLSTNLLIIGGELEYFPKFGSSQDELEGLFAFATRQNLQDVRVKETG